MNTLKTTLLLATLTALTVLLGDYIGGRQGALMALAFAGVMNFVSFWFSDRIVLKLYRAQEIGPNDLPELRRIVQGLTERAGLPMPRLFHIPSDQPNAFATGRSPQHAAVAVTDGLLRLMNAEEIEGVLAHELAHVSNRDTLTMAVAATAAGAIMMLARWAQFAAIFGGGRGDDRRGGGIQMLALAILAPIAALLIQSAISRSREFAADAAGAGFVGSPKGLARALEKLGSYSGRIPMPQADAASAHMFIVNPLAGSQLANLFSTHPPLEERIARLKAMG